MKFDTLCSIILEGKNLMKTRVAVVNPNPIFSMDDVLKNPADPGAGVRTYIDDNIEGHEDPERIARRALRRINWVAKSMVKRIGSRELDIHKLLINIMCVLEKYLKNVMRYTDEQITAEQLKISKEAAFIGKLLLPPNNRMPNAKGVFGSGEGIDVEEKGKKGGRETVEDRIRHEFDMSVDEYLAAFDPDLIGTIKAIIKEGHKAGSVREITPEDLSGDETTEIAEEAVEGAEGTDTGINGVAAVDIMKDPRIRGIYDPRVVRKVLKSMIELGSVVLTPDSRLVLPPEGTEQWRSSLERARGRKRIEDQEASLPAEDEVKNLKPEFEAEPDETVAPAHTSDDEEEGDVDALQDVAAQRLGYKASKHGAAEETPREEDDDDSWQQ